MAATDQMARLARAEALVARLEAMQAQRPDRFQGQARLARARLSAQQIRDLIARQGGAASVASQLTLPASAAEALGPTKYDLSGLPIPSWLPGAAIGAGAVAVAGGAVAAGMALSRRRKPKSSGKSKRKGGKSRSHRTGHSSGRGKPDRNRRGGAVKDKYRGSKVYRTKRGQPYIILGSGPMKGRARFIRA